MSAQPLQQLTGLDALFLTQEAADTPMHIGLLMLYRPPGSSGAVVRFKDLLGTFRRRAHAAPVFYQTLGEVPFGMDYPFWLDAQQLALAQLRARGRLDEDSALVASFAERQRLVQKDLFDQLDARYSI